MKTIKKIVLLFVLASLALASCVKDNSNTYFNELNDVQISGIKTYYEVTLGDQLTINPTVTLAKDDVSYVWYTYSAISTGKRDTLSHEKNLNVVLTGSNVEPGTAYKLVFRITDNKTGVFTSAEVDLMANSLYTKGLVMLCENNNEIELNMLLPNERVLKDVYSLNNDGKKLNKNYRQLAFANPNSLKPEMKQLFLFADQEDGGVVLDPVTLNETNPVREIFDDKIDEPVLSVRDYTGKMGMIDYIFLNNKLCKRTVNMSTLFFQAAPLVVSNSASDFSIAAIVSNMGGYDEDYDEITEGEPIVYDDMNGRLLYHSPWNKGTLGKMTSNIVSSTAIFDPDNMGNYAFVASGEIADWTYWMLGRERSTNELVLFKFIFDRGWSNELDDYKLIFKPLSKTKITAAIAPNLNKDAQFVPYTGMYNTGFYVWNNFLYSLNIGNIGTGTMAEAQQADLSAMEVTGCRYKRIVVADPTPSKPDNKRNIEQIRVMVQDNSLATQKGGVIYFEITTDGGIKAKEVYRHIGGFCDKIIDIVEKDA